jgi:hypothetical protein
LRLRLRLRKLDDGGRRRFGRFRKVEVEARGRGNEEG